MGPCPSYPFRGLRCLQLLIFLPLPRPLPQQRLLAPGNAPGRCKCCFLAIATLLQCSWTLQLCSFFLATAALLQLGLVSGPSRSLRHRFAIPRCPGPLQRPCNVANPALATAPAPGRSWYLFNAPNPLPEAILVPVQRHKSCTGTLQQRSWALRLLPRPLQLLLPGHSNAPRSW